MFRTLGSEARPELLSTLLDNLALRTSVEWSLAAAPGAVHFQDLDNVRQFFTDRRDSPITLAITELGSYPVTMIALKRVGIRVVAPYWKIPKQYSSVASDCCAMGIDIALLEDKASVLKQLLSAQRQGFIPLLLLEAPGRSRCRFEFLGYKVYCSELLSRFAILSGSSVVIVVGHVISSNRVSLEFLEIGQDNCSTARLLVDLEKLIEVDCLSYNWNGQCIVFSDESASRNGLSCLPDILSWRALVESRVSIMTESG